MSGKFLTPKLSHCVNEYISVGIGIHECLVFGGAGILAGVYIGSLVRVIMLVFPIIQHLQSRSIWDQRSIYYSRCYLASRSAYPNPFLFLLPNLFTKGVPLPSISALNSPLMTLLNVGNID